MVDETKKPAAMFGEVDGSVIGYMCLTDFECELGSAKGGNRVFASESDLRATCKCVDTCGIAKVQVIGLEVIQEADYRDAEIL